MKTSYSFNDVRSFLREANPNDPQLIAAIDALTGMALLSAPLAIGSMALPALTLISAKNELIKAAKYLLQKLSRAGITTPIDRCQRLQLAYAMTCTLSIGEALSDALSRARKLLKVPAGSDFTFPACETKPNVDIENSQMEFAFPFSTDDMEAIESTFSMAARTCTESLKSAVQLSIEWSKADAKLQAKLTEDLEKTAKSASEFFRANVVALAREFHDFAIWLQIYRDERLSSELNTTVDALAKSKQFYEESRDAIDVGLTRLQTLVQTIPDASRNDSADKVIVALHTRYSARLAEPIIRESASRAAIDLTFPKVRDIFIPQSFKAIRNEPGVRLELESTWDTLKSYNELGPFLLHTLSSPYSFNLPLVILGHPGSGKSLLSEVLAHALLGDTMFPIRVPLRDVNADSEIQTQIEEWIRAFTGEQCTWTDLSRRLIDRGTPPLIIFDGYDELLQASGRVFSNYVISLRRFLEREEELGRCARAIVTSRMTLIDKAVIPKNTTVLRLENFDPEKQKKWISIWNASNARIFRDRGIQPLEIPNANAKIAELATQPLLLLMLALYDSEGNALARSHDLDQTALYHDLLRQFIVRERTKGDAADAFNALSEGEQGEEIDHDMNRLGVAAIGMFNRRSLYISNDDLNADISFFQVDDEVSPSPAKQLSAAEKLLGSFFFVHQSRSGKVESVTKSPSAFEFLHNTFGEFLTADFILRRVLGEVEVICDDSQESRRRSRLDLRLAQATAFPLDWYACLAHTPLHSRPVVLEMLQEWASHRLASKGITRHDFLHSFDIIIDNQLERILNNATPPSMFSEERRSPFPRFPLIGHFAIYSLNLIVLRSILASEPYKINVEAIDSHDDGTDAWEQLTYLWRSWFSFSNLGALGNVFVTERASNVPILVHQPQLTGAGPTKGTQTIRRVSSALGDDLLRVLSGLCFDVDIEGGWLSELTRAMERLDLPLSLSVKVRQIEDAILNGTAPSGAIEKLISLAINCTFDKPQLEQIAQVRLLSIAQTCGYEDAVFRVVRQRVDPRWVAMAAEPLVIAFAEWLAERAVDVEPGVFRDLLTRLSRTSSPLLKVLIRKLFASNSRVWMAIVWDGSNPFDKSLDTTRINPETALELLKCASYAGDNKWVKDTWSRLFNRKAAVAKNLSAEGLYECLVFANSINENEWVKNTFDELESDEWKQLRECSIEHRINVVKLAVKLHLHATAKSAWECLSSEANIDFRFMTSQTAVEYVELATQLGSKIMVEEMLKAIVHRASHDLRVFPSRGGVSLLKFIGTHEVHSGLESVLFQTLRRSGRERGEMLPEALVEMLLITRDLGNKKMLREVWSMLVQRDPKEFVKMPVLELVGLLKIADDLKEHSWIVDAVQSWKKLSPTFSAIADERVVQLLQSV